MENRIVDALRLKTQAFDEKRKSAAQLDREAREIARKVSEKAAKERAERRSSRYGGVRAYGKNDV